MKPKLFDTVKLLVSLPDESLPKGAIGAIIEEFSEPTEAYEVEFTDKDGRTISQVTLRAEQFVVVDNATS